MTTVALKDVTKVFPDGTVAVDNVSLDVADGEFMVLLGPSGCGKSTVLRMIAGLEDPTAGAILLDGELANDLPPRDRRIAMVFQDFALYPHMSVGDNIGFPLRLSGVEPGPARRAGGRRGQRAGHRRRAGPQAQPALRRPAPAGRDGPRDRAPARPVPHGRAAVQPRQRAAGRAAGRDLRPGPRAGRQHHLRHARPGRGAHHGRPGGDPAPGRPAGRRHADPGVRPPGDALRRRVPRQPPDEPARGVGLRAPRPLRRAQPRRAGAVPAVGRHPGPGGRRTTTASGSSSACGPRR